MSKIADAPLTHLPPAAAWLARIFGRPKALAVACVVALAGLGWLTLGVLIAGAPGAALGPGTGLLDRLPRLVDALCRPAASGAIASLGNLALIWLMWCAMTLAMMLPSAAPMIYTYAEIADTATGKGEPVVSPLVLAGGYIAVWLGFAAAATLLQWLLVRVALLDPSMLPSSALVAGVIFVAAGLYQFSALKHACLRQCQQPFPFFFANWQTTPRGVARLGLRQGLYCLGCCWAMMLVMFAVGTMNVVWMAGLGIVMTIEKMTTGTRFTKIVGVAMIAVGVLVILQAVAAHWPARA